MNKRKTLWTILVLASYIILILLSVFNPKFDSQMIQKVTYIFPLTCTFIIYAYNNWNWVFVLLRKFIARLSGDTVSLKLSYKKYVALDFNYDKFKTALHSLIRQRQIDSLKISNTDDRIALNYVYCGLKYEFIIYSERQPDDFQLYIEMNASTAYKDSRIIIREFFYFTQEIDKITPSLFKKDDAENAKMSNSFYSATIQMSKYNPFYKYVIKHIQPVNDDMFRIKLILDKDISIKISHHKMIINNADEESLKRILKNYVPISTIG